MKEKTAKLVEQLERMKEGAQHCVDNGVRFYTMHAPCAVEFATNVLELVKNTLELLDIDEKTLLEISNFVYRMKGRLDAERDFRQIREEPKHDYEFIKGIISDLVKRGIMDLNGKAFNEWCLSNDFIPWRIREEIVEFKSTEEGQRYIVKL